MLLASVNIFWCNTIKLGIRLAHLFISLPFFSMDLGSNPNTVQLPMWIRFSVPTWFKGFPWCSPQSNTIQKINTQIVGLCNDGVPDLITIIIIIINVFITRLFQRIQSTIYFYFKVSGTKILKLWDLILSTPCNGLHGATAHTAATARNTRANPFSFR